MKPKTMIVLVLAVAVGVIFIVLRHGGPGEKVGRPPRVATYEGFFKPAPLGVKELTITSADGHRLVFAKADGAWQMLEPVHARADGFKVNEIADALLSPSVTLVEGEDAADEITGLDKPHWTLTLTDEQDRTYSLAVGQAAPMSGGARTYVRDQAGKQVFVAAFDFSTRLSRPASEYRDKALWDIHQADIRRITIAGRDSYELIRTGQGWEIAARQFRAAAAGEKVRLLLDKLVYLTVSDFVAEPLADPVIYGLDKPRLTVRMELAEKISPASGPTTASHPSTQPATAQAARVYELALGATTGNVVYAKLADSPTVFQLTSSLMEELQPRLADIRNRRVLRLGEQAVVGVDIERPEGKIVLVEKDGLWRMELPFAGPAEEATVQQLLERLNALKAESFNDEPAPPAAYGLEKPQSTITLHLADGDRAMRLLIGGRSSSSQMTFVRSAEETSVAVVRTEEVEALLQDPAVYWDTTLFKISADVEAVAMEVDNQEERIALALDTKSGLWVLTKPGSAPVDAAAANDLITALRNLSARKIVSLARTVPDRYAKAKGKITVKLTTATVPPTTSKSNTSTASVASAPVPQAKTKSYTLHAVKLEGVVYAWLDGAAVAAVGEMDQTFLDKLTAEFRNRDVGLPTGSQVEGIRIALDKATLVLHRRTGQWRCESDPYVGISDVKVDAFLKNVRLLKAQRFVAHRGERGKGEKRFGLDKPHLVVEVTPASGAVYKLMVSAIGPEGFADRYASCTAAEGAFLLSSQAVAGLSKTLKDFSD